MSTVSNITFLKIIVEIFVTHEMCVEMINSNKSLMNKIKQERKKKEKKKEIPTGSVLYVELPSIETDSIQQV